MSISWRKFPTDIETSFVDGVWNQTILPNRIDQAMWNEHFRRLMNHAQAGWGKSFKDATDLAEWEKFQKIEANLRKFAAHKQHRIIEELRLLKAKGLSRADFDKAAAAVLRRHNRTWLKAELQAATASAQAAESWQHFEARAYLYPNLRYETAGDERVRYSHQALDKTVRPVHDSFWDTHAPPLGWNCRCKLVQVDEAVTNLPDLSTLKIPKGFDQNPGKTFKLFSDSHPYFDVPTLDREALEQLSKTFHAAVTSDEVQAWAKKDLAVSIPGMTQDVTISPGEVADITAGPHVDQPSRNELLYVIERLQKEQFKFAGRTHGDKDLMYLYYLVQAYDQNYYLHILASDTERRWSITAITDNLPNAP